MSLHMNPQKRGRIFSASTLIAFVTLAIYAGFAQNQPAQVAVRRADPAHYLQNIKTLTMPSMEGRGDGTKGLTLAAEFLQKEYKSLGLLPAGTNGYLQPFELSTGARISGANEISYEN